VTGPSASRRSDQRSYLAGLLGQGIGPSLSPELHEREAARQGLRYTYKTVELAGSRLDRESLAGLLAHAVELGFDGLNVTHPVKQVMASVVDELAPEAAAIGAVNTVLVDGGRTRGHNTDVTGFATAVGNGLAGADIERVVLVGAGGAGTAVAHALAGLGVRQLRVVDTDAGRAERLAGTVRGEGLELVIGAPAELPRLVTTASGLVNATPMGMAAHPGSPVDPALLRDDLWVADVVYRPLLTELVREASARGCRVLTGAGMAINQAADSFELITGRPADRSAMTRDFDELVADEVGPAAQRRE
jgi:shikimate dehydrogenase